LTYWRPTRDPLNKLWTPILSPNAEHSAQNTLNPAKTTHKIQLPLTFWEFFGILYSQLRWFLALKLQRNLAEI